MQFLGILLISSVDNKKYFTFNKLMTVSFNYSWGSLNEQKVIVDEEDLVSLQKEAVDSLLRSKLVMSHAKDLN